MTGPLSDDIGKCASLKQLILPDNKISGNFPESYGNLHQLVSLNLLQTAYRDGNTLCPLIPSSWKSLFSLQSVFLCATGPIPDFIGECWQQLQVLRIVRNSRESGNQIPPSLCKLTQLQNLDLAYSHLTGPIPGCIFSMTSLVYLDLFNNNFSGPIPETIGNLHNVKVPSLDYNHLTGPLPPSIGKLAN